MRNKILAAFTAACLLLAGCAKAPKNNTPTGGAPQQTLVVYTSHWEEVYGPIVKEFQERTGIWVFVEEGGTLELMQRLEEESGSPACDVLFGGGAETHEAYSHLFQPYKSALADEVDPAYLPTGNLWTPFAVLPIVIVYNTKLVPKPPTSWQDLLSEEWAGLVAFTDPSVSASSFTSLATLMQAVDGDPWQAEQRFAENMQGRLLTKSSEVIASVAGGQYPVGICLEEAAYRELASGSQIGILYPSDGTSMVPDASSLVKNAPNEDAAKLFIDFTIAKEVQQQLVEGTGRRPVRPDVEQPAALTPIEEIAVLPYDYAWANENREQILYVWQREL